MSPFGGKKEAPQEGDKGKLALPPLDARTVLHNITVEEGAIRSLVTKSRDLPQGELLQEGTLEYRSFKNPPGMPPLVVVGLSADFFDKKINVTYTKDTITVKANKGKTDVVTTITLDNSHVKSVTVTNNVVEGPGSEGFTVEKRFQTGEKVGKFQTGEKVGKDLPHGSTIGIIALAGVAYRNGSAGSAVGFEIVLPAPQPVPVEAK